MVFRQTAFTSLDREGFLRRVEPEVAFPGADAAVTTLGTCDFGDDKGEFEGSAVAVAVVGF